MVTFHDYSDWERIVQKINGEGDMATFKDYASDERQIREKVTENIEPSVFGGISSQRSPNPHFDNSIRRWLPKDCEMKTMNIADGGSVEDKLFERPECEHPDYYKGTNEGGRSIEVFDIIDQFVNGDFYLGNVLKYVCRAGKKSKETKRQDLEKALHYIKEAIKRI